MRIKFYGLLFVAIMAMLSPTVVGTVQEIIYQKEIEQIQQQNVEEYEESISAKVMFDLSVEAAQGVWGQTWNAISGIKDNVVDGWNFCYTENDKAGFSCTVWQNK